MNPVTLASLNFSRTANPHLEIMKELLLNRTKETAKKEIGTFVNEPYNKLLTNLERWVLTRNSQTSASTYVQD